MDTLALFHGFGYEAVFMYTNSINVILIIAMIDLQLQNERRRMSSKEIEKRVAQVRAIRSGNNPIRLISNAMDTLALFHGFGYEALFMFTN